MDNKNEIESLSKTLMESDLSSILEDEGEHYIDSVIKNDLLKDIPIIRTIVGFLKAAYSTKEYLFFKKIITFLSSIENIPAQERNKMISKINNSGKYKTKVGEKLLFILDRCDDTEKASLIAKVFSAFLKEEINYSEYTQIAHIINNIFIEDFKYFVKIDPQNIYMEDAQLYISYGLCQIIFGEPEIELNDLDWKGNYGNKYHIVNGENKYNITDIGKLVMKIFKE